MLLGVWLVGFLCSLNSNLVLFPGIKAKGQEW